MLVEIKCDQFIDHGMPRGTISLHAGLNTVVGGAAADNSVGKSTFLMIIDFIYGGSDYVERLTDVQDEVGEHCICFTFQFGDQFYHFMRSNVDYRIVAKCDRNYQPLPEGQLSLDQYLRFLQEMYHLDYTGLTFRNAVGRSIRVWKRDTLDESRPLHQARQERTGTAIEGLLRLANLYKNIEAQSRLTKEIADKYATIKKAQKYQYLPCVRKEADYSHNEKRIKELVAQKAELRRQSTGGFLNLDSLQSEQLSSLQMEMSNIRRRRNKCFSQLQAYRMDRMHGERGFQRDYTELLRFFPGANLQPIEATEHFHDQLINVLQEEFEESERAFLSEIAALDSQILQIEESMHEIAAATDISEVVLQQYSAMENEQRALQEANDNYRKMNALGEEARDHRQHMDRLVVDQISVLL